LKNINPLRTLRRRAQRLERLGSEHAFCLRCGCSEPMVLRPVTRSFLEQHHVVGLVNDADLTLALCFNCHALITERLHQAGVSMTREPDGIKFAANVFRALAVHHSMLSEASWRFSALVTTEKDESTVVVRIWQRADVLGFMFQMAWPVWKANRGRVPSVVLRRLEKDGDWPRGCARAIMERINKDSGVRKELSRRSERR
jgi:hypothetical protein